MSPYHQLSVELRFLRNGDEKLFLLRNYNATAGETVQEVAKSCAKALGDASVVLETKSVLVFDADYGEFVQVEPSECVRSVRRMQLALEMHGSGRDCEDLL
ncbi:hypothetical protein AAVH_39884 [Aphelenchoides avenae]|nr:hypothetical protein AAVH_39884 [Aphelenchus avenae]